MSIKFVSLQKNIFSILIVLVILAQDTVAQTIPSFPFCLDPQGTLISKHDNGTHGVPDDPTAYTGSDAVFHVTDRTLIQCLCPDEGTGIQTNWWKVDHLSEREKDNLIRSGWHLVYNGYAWGLDSAPYLTQNISYSCLGGRGGAGVGGMQGASAKNLVGDVLGLASTGNNASLFLLTVTGILSITTGLILQKLYTQRHN